MTGDDSLCRALVRDYTRAGLSPADRAMLDYAVKLTLQPRRMERTDVDTLREHGFDDTAILDICQVAAYYNYVNRLADGLGVELEEYWDAERIVVTREEMERWSEERRSRDDSREPEKGGRRDG